MRTIKRISTRLAQLSLIAVEAENLKSVRLWEELMAQMDGLSSDIGLEVFKIEHEEGRPNGTKNPSHV